MCRLYNIFVGGLIDVRRGEKVCHWYNMFVDGLVDVQGAGKRLVFCFW